MKKLIINLGFILGVSTMVVGCTDYLDSDYLFEERVNIENVFQSKDYTNEWLAKGYAYMNHDYLQQVNSKKNTSFNFADDMYYIDLNYVDWKGGNYTEKGLGSGNSLYIWQAAYQAIRHISIFIHNVDGNKELTEAEITDMKGQAHFLRAYFYWMLIRSFGPVNFYILDEINKSLARANAAGGVQGEGEQQKKSDMASHYAKKFEDLYEVFNKRVGGGAGRK